MRPGASLLRVAVLQILLLTTAASGWCVQNPSSAHTSLGRTKSWFRLRLLVARRDDDLGGTQQPVTVTVA